MRFIDVVREIRGEGLPAFYAGFLTNLVRIMPHYAIIFVLYEYFSQNFHKLIDWSSMETIISAADISWSIYVI